MLAASLRMNGVVKTFGPALALNGFDLALESGELVALVGPSGCGKTTALHAAAGLIAIDAGDISLFGRSLAGVPPRDRDTAMVFQGGALYPHLTVEQNLAFPLKARGREGKRAVRNMADRLHIAHLLDRRPAKISGGEAQRVALGRALIRKPKLFLLDEPLAGLDAPLREELRELVRDLVRETGVTAIFVTHDQAEALAVGDRVAVMHAGRVAQIGSPRDIYDRPRNLAVARFFGRPAINLLRGAIEKGVVMGSWGRLNAAGPVRSGDVVCAFRPERCVIGGQGGLDALVTHVDFFGSETAVTASLPDAETIRALLPANGRLPQRGEKIRIAAAPDSIRLFDAETGEAL